MTDDPVAIYAAYVGHSHAAACAAVYAAGRASALADAASPLGGPTVPAGSGVQLPAQSVPTPTAEQLAGKR